MGKQEPLPSPGTACEATGLRRSHLWGCLPGGTSCRVKKIKSNVREGKTACGWEGASETSRQQNKSWWSADTLEPSGLPRGLKDASISGDPLNYL